MAEASGLFIVNGALIMVYGTANYFRVQRCIARGFFPQNKVGVIAVFLSTSSLTAVALYKLVNFPPHRTTSRIPCLFCIENLARTQKDDGR